MDNIFEILVPLIFAAIYFVGKMLSGKGDQEDPSPGMPGRKNRQEDGEVAERQRRIQEEIRRKIMERCNGSPAPQPEQPQAAPQTSSQGLTRADEEIRRRREERDRARQQRQAEARAALSSEQLSSRTPAPDPSSGANPYESQMDAQLRRIEETKRQAAQLQQRAEAVQKKASVKTSSRGRSGGGLLRGPLRESLIDPAAVRAAFIYGEVLGRPMGLRGSESSVPGLSK